jgi:hypothetical protein
LETVDVSPRESRAKLRVNIGNSLFDAIADTGSDRSNLDKLTTDYLCTEGILNPIQALPQPLTLSPAIEVNEAGEILKRQAFVANGLASVTFVLQLAAGPLVIAKRLQSKLPCQIYCLEN